MKQLTTIKPYSDEKLTWNETLKQYELAFKFCKAEYPSNFADDDTLKRRIKKNTRNVYRYVEYHVNSYNKKIVNAIISHTEEGRQFIFDLLSTQFESDVDSGYNDIGDTSAINVANGQIIDRNEIRRNLVSVATEEVFDNSQSYFGINIGYQAPFPSYYFILLRNL